jgi:hypothetical protein
MKRINPTVVVVGLLAALGIRACIDPLPMERLQRLRKGMTQAEVRQILGPHPP